MMLVYLQKNILPLKISGLFPDTGRHLKFIILCICIPVLTTNIQSQQPVLSDSTRYSDNSSADLNTGKTWTIGAVTAVGYGGTLLALSEVWYKDYASSSFQTFNDSREWLQVDKLGHGWTAYNTGRATAALWQWAGIPHKKAVWIGGLTGFAFLTGIEVLDGHSAKWGWSWSDMGANIVGTGLYMSQELLWSEQRIQYKFSFHPGHYTDPVLRERTNDLFGGSWPEQMLKDYNTQTYWLSANIRSFLKSSSLPAWLNLAIGYGATGMYGGFENQWMDPQGNSINRFDIPRKRQFYLAPDIDFTRIKTKSKFLRTAFSVLNSFKFPAPAIMLDSKGKFKAYAIYF